VNHEIYYDPIDYQEEFQESTKPKVFLSSGLGGGKTYALMMKILKLCSINAGLAGGLLVPTLKMFKRDVVPTITEITMENDIAFRFHKTEYYFYFADTDSIVYIFHDDPATIKGPNLAFMGINEVSLCSEASFKACVGRVRVKKAKQLQVAMSGTPEGFGWDYEYFVEEPRADTDFIMGDMRKNIHIHESYVQTLLESYDDLLVEQYVEGKYVNLFGKRAVRKFDRKKHVIKDLKPNDLATKWISIDFNVDPMGATIWDRLPLSAKSKQTLHAVDEICIPNESDTYELCDVLAEKISPDDYVIGYPDPAGTSRATSARGGKTDIIILKQAKRKNGALLFDEIRHRPKIKSVKDCLNALNNFIHKDRMRISSKCKNFIADLEQCTIKQGTFEIDKSNPKRSHWLDGAKNMIEYEFPIKAKTHHWSKKVR